MYKSSSEGISLYLNLAKGPLLGLLMLRSSFYVRTKCLPCVMHRNDYPNALSKVQFFAASKFIT